MKEEEKEIVEETIDKKEKKSKKKKFKLTKKKVIIGLILLYIIVSFIRGRMSTEENANKVQVDTIEKRTLVTTISASGRLESTTSKAYDSMLSGREVKKVYVKVGDKVNKGDILCSFDMDDAQDQYNLASSSLKTATEQANIQVDQAKRALDKASSVKNDYEALKAEVNSLRTRMEQINIGKNQHKGNAEVEAQLAQEERDVSTQLADKWAKLQAIEASYNESQVNESINQAQDAVRSAELAAKAAQDQSKAQINQIKSTLDKGKIVSAVDGTVTQVNVKEGDTFTGGTVIKVEGINEFKIEAQISEYDIADIKEGMKVLIKTDSTREEELNGTVTFVAPAATEAASSVMAAAQASTAPSYKIEISLDETNDRLRIGMTAKLSIIKEEAKDVLSVPYDAVYTREDGTNYLKVQENDEIREINVTKGLESDYYTEVKSDEIKEGMTVVLPDLNNQDALEEMINSMTVTTGI